MGIFEQHPIKISGDVSAGFEAVRTTFEQNMSRYAETCAQLCVYKGADKVVDLWAAPADNKNFDGDSLVNIFSSGKSLESIAIACLADRGLLSFDDKITDYWPEFGKNGKENTTIADMMRHEAGLAALTVSIDPNDLVPEAIKENRIGQVLENEAPYFRAEDLPREYHAISRGWIVNEVFRRIDPEGRTLGEFYWQEIHEDLGLDIHVGLQRQYLERRSPLVPIHPGRHIRETFKPNFMKRGVGHNMFQLAGNLIPVVKGLRQARTDLPPPLVGMKDIEFFNEAEMAMGETSSANTHASARGLAKLASIMACGGESGETRLLGEEGWQALHDNPKRSDMMAMSTAFTQGGVASFGELSPNPSRLEVSLNRGRDGFFGWMGLGGSVFQWHPEKQIGFAFVPTRLHMLDLVNERGKLLQQATLSCA